MTPTQRRKRAFQALLLALGLSVAAILPAERPIPVDLCGFKRLTSLPCPTCGLTRAFCAAARGDWARSLSFHPVGIPLAGALAVWALWLGAEAAAGRPLRPELRAWLIRPLMTAGILASAGFWIARLALGRTGG